MITFLSSLMIPLLVLIVLGYGLRKKVNVYDTFVEGAKESFDMFFTIFPNLLGMMLAINLFLHSGILDVIFQCLGPFFEWIQVPLEIVPMAIMRPISGSSALAILNDLFQNYGPDSLIGRIASVIQGSTDTTFYVLTLYFGSVGIRKIKHALWTGLCADLIGIVTSIIIVRLLFP